MVFAPGRECRWQQAVYLGCRTPGHPPQGYRLWVEGRPLVFGPDGAVTWTGVRIFRTNILPPAAVTAAIAADDQICDYPEMEVPAQAVALLGVFHPDPPRIPWGSWESEHGVPAG